MTTVRVADITSQIRGVSYKPSDVKEGQIRGAKPILRANNITADGLVFDDLVWVDEKVISEHQLLQKFDIVIAASSGSKSVIGKASQLGQSWEGSFGAFCKVLRPKIDKVDPKYLYYFFQTKEYRTTVSFLASGANINNLRNEHLDNLQIPLPPLPIQKKIATILDKADSLRQKDKQLFEHYNKLGQSIFYELFGYNGQLESKYDKLPLSSVSEIVSGVTLNSKNVNPDWKSYPYLRVFNVQDGFFDLSKIKHVKVSQAEFERYVLKKNDILLTEGGDPDKLGRGSIWSSEIDNCVHQNHVFRVRITSGDFHPVFISSLLGSTYGKKYFLKAAKQTTGIASINSTQLKAFPLVKPSLSLQKKFNAVIQKTNEAKEQVKNNIDKSEHLFQTLLQKAFKGELVKEP